MAIAAETGQAMLAREQLVGRAVMIRGEPVRPVVSHCGLKTMLSRQQAGEYGTGSASSELRSRAQRTDGLLASDRVRRGCQNRRSATRPPTP